jgi:hypothetical protein
MLLLLSHLPKRGLELCELIRTCALPDLATEIGEIDGSATALTSSIVERIADNARCIVVVPDFAVALSVDPPDSEDKVQARRSAWLSGARQCVHAATTLRDRVLLVPPPSSADEVERLFKVCQRFASAKFERPSTTSTPPLLDPVIRSLGRYMAETDAELAAVSADLQALTTPLVRGYVPASAASESLVSALCTHAQVTQRADAIADREELLVAQVLQLETELRKRPRNAPPDRVPHDIQRLLAPLDLIHGGVHIGKAGGETSHRHLNLELMTQKKSDRAPLPKLSVRLVDHGGSPGLLLFLPATDAGLPLPDWTPSGQENGRRFLLLHPRHLKARQQFAALGWRDALTMTYVCRAIRHALEINHQSAGDRGRPLLYWRYVAQQLEHDVAALPPVWRARDSRLLQPLAAGASQFAAEYDDAWVGGCLARSVTATAVFDAGGAHRLEVSARDASQPLLSFGALADSDVPDAARHSVAFGILKPWRAALGSWAKYEDRDLALLDSLLVSLEAHARANPADASHAIAGLTAMHAEVRAAVQRRLGKSRWWSRLRAAAS